MVKGALHTDSLQGKTIVVTGGGTGLGKAMSTYFSSLGANLVISSRKLDVLTGTAAEISKQTGNPVLPVACDVRNEDDIQKMLQAAEEKFGQVDILVNNAAGNFISPTERLSANAFSTIIDIVLKGTVNCTLAFGKNWIAKKQRASVLNIVTTYAFTGSGFVVPSAVAKAGVATLTKSLAVEWGKYGIRHNAIAPGPFPTKGAWDRLLPGDLMEKFDFKNRVPLKRVGDHQELANLAAFLISDYAQFINGEIVTIDGGEWLQGAGEFSGLEAIPSTMWDTIEENIRTSNKANKK
ncbi:SDR family oxidoreductase [Sphingobacterium psychroaquaticum]|uniref:SDR family oxidoreductase n=1 Tax=Sphingobacterium psychroaquaticum TaxID=561061 RepID=UPI00106CA092|nr:SDR family oxidoreductase [Sphingobacterium psychroaquaticum]QBQ39775.1 SDR family oxidoreductase [Sphingobacterium psychroaquaticum]